MTILSHLLNSLPTVHLVSLEPFPRRVTSRVGQYARLVERADMCAARRAARKMTFVSGVTQ